MIIFNRIHSLSVIHMPLPRGQHGSHREPEVSWSDQELEEIEEAHANGMSVQQIVDAFTARGEDRLMSLIVPANTASKRVARKAGLHMTDQVEVFENLSDRFVLTEPDWRSRTET